MLREKIERKFIGVWFRMDDVKRIAKECKKLNKTISEFIRDAVLEKLERMGQ